MVPFFVLCVGKFFYCLCPSFKVTSACMGKDRRQTERYSREQLGTHDPTCSTKLVCIKFMRNMVQNSIQLVGTGVLDGPKKNQILLNIEREF